MAVFKYSSPILEQFPTIVAAVALGENLTNGPSQDALCEAYAAEQQSVISSIGSKPLSELEPISAWRNVFRSFGVNPTKYRSAAESLLRRLTKKGDIPCINTIVDICNMVSIRYAVPIAGIDMREMEAPITVHFSDGTENFKPLGTDKIEHPDKNEVVFSDEKKRAAARRWCWRQSEESAAGRDTSRVLFTIEAHHASAEKDVKAALDDLLELLNLYAGGTYSHAVLNKERAGF